MELLNPPVIGLMYVVNSCRHAGIFLTDLTFKTKGTQIVNIKVDGGGIVSLPISSISKVT